MVVYNPDTRSVSLVYLVLLHPGCQHPPSPLPAQDGGPLWSTPIGSRHAVRWAPAPAVGPALSGLAFGGTLGSLRLSPTLAVPVILLEVAWRTPATRRAAVMVTGWCTCTALRWTPRACKVCCSAPSSPSATWSSAASPSPTPRRHFPGSSSLRQSGVHIHLLWCRSCC